MTKDLISVIVPIYNIEPYVGYCIESLIKQTYRNLEIILVDDGSTDRSSFLCDLYASKDARIKVIHKPNGGLVSARKAGAAAAEGEYIGYVDGDDWVEPTYYAAMFQAAKRSGADIVCAGYSKDLFHQQIKCSDQFLDGIYEGQTLEKLWRGMMSFEDTFQVGITTYVWNKLFRAGIVRDVQMRVDERITIGEDGAVTYPALLRAKSVYVCENSDYHYRQREGSMLKQHNAFRQEAEKLRALYECIRSAFEEDPRRDYLLPQLTDYVLCNCIMRAGGLNRAVFEPDFRGKRVAIIQAGTFGQLIYDRLLAANYCTVVGWYDEDYWEYRRCGMNVDPLPDLVHTELDYAVIAKLDQRVVGEIREFLLKMGVPAEKILSVSYQALDRPALLKEFLSQ